MFYHLDSSGRLYGTLLSLALTFNRAINCTVLPIVSKFMSFKNAASQTALFLGAYSFTGNLERC